MVHIMVPGIISGNGKYAAVLMLIPFLAIQALYFVLSVAATPASPIVSIYDRGRRRRRSYGRTSGRSFCDG